MAVKKTEQFSFSAECGRVSVFERAENNCNPIAVYDVKTGNENESMVQFQNLCAPNAEIGLDYADLVAVVSESKSGSYYYFDDEDQFLRILQERNPDIGSILVLFEGDVSLSSVVPYQGLFSEMEADVLFQIDRNESMEGLIRYHVWLFEKQVEKK